MTNFENELWIQLACECSEQMRAAPKATAALASSVTDTGPVTERNPRLRRQAVVTGSALGIAGMATAGMLALTSASPAFAVTNNPNGTVAITLSDLSDLHALNQRLAQDGVPVTAVPITTNCSAAATITNPSGESGPSNQTSQQTDVVTIDPSQIPSGDTGVLGASETASGQITLLFGDTTAPAPSCLNSAAFNTGQGGETSTRGTP